MKKFVQILFCLATLAFTACGGGEFKGKLIHLDSLIIEHPDSVYQVLEGMKEEARGQSKSSRMYYELLRADAQNKAYIDFTTDSVMKIVADYYDHHGNANEQMRAHYLLGCTYRDLNDVPMELQCFQEAVEKADTTDKDCDLYTLSSVFGQMADLYHSQFLPNEELKTLKKCENVAWQNKDTLGAIKAYELHTRAYNISNLEDSVINTIKKSRENYINIGDTAYAARITIPAVRYFIKKGDYKAAKTYIDIFEKQSRAFSNGIVTEQNLSIYYFSKGILLQHEGDLDSAKLCFYKLLSTKLYKEAAYKGLLTAYRQEHNADSIEKYAVLFANTNDSSYLGSQHERIAQMTAMYDYGVQKKKAEMAQQHVIKSDRTIFILSITVLGLIILTTILYLYFYLKKRSVSKKINSLQADIKHYTLTISDIQNNSNEKVESLKKLLEESKNELAKYKESQTLSAFFDSETYSTFKKASRNGSYIISKTEWENLEILFNNTFSSYSDFILSGHSMSSPQLYVCMLIRMGFGETEMANILDVDLKRISRIKSQINQKLFNTQSARTLASNLNEYF